MNLYFASTRLNVEYVPISRTESVVEKFLTNWLSICMYSYLKVSCFQTIILSLSKQLIYQYYLTWLILYVCGERYIGLLLNIGSH